MTGWKLTVILVRKINHPLQLIFTNSISGAL